VDLTYNWDPEPYSGGRNFGHLAYAVDKIYDTCSAFIASGVTINRRLRDGRMAFIRPPDGISIELLQATACRTLDQHGQRRFMVRLEAPGVDWVAAGVREGRGALPLTGARPRAGRRGAGGGSTARRRWHDDGAGDLRDAVCSRCRPELMADGARPSRVAENPVRQPAIRPPARLSAPLSPSVRVLTFTYCVQVG
jgi:Glyoxalase/Bleomycin resistance protein/Dioxygenase superfamily